MTHGVIQGSPLSSARMLSPWASRKLAHHHARVGGGEGGRAESGSVGSLLLTQHCTYYLQSQLIGQNLVT